MIRINDKFTKYIIEDNKLESHNIRTEMEDLGYYNVSLNIIKLNDTSFGLNNILFDFYKSTLETTKYTEDGVTFKSID